MGRGGELRTGWLPIQVTSISNTPTVIDHSVAHTADGVVSMETETYTPTEIPDFKVGMRIYDGVKGIGTLQSKAIKALGGGKYAWNVEWGDGLKEETLWGAGKLLYKVDGGNDSPPASLQEGRTLRQHTSATSSKAQTGAQATGSGGGRNTGGKDRGNGGRGNTGRNASASKAKVRNVST